jgi:hypothetical protein
MCSECTGSPPEVSPRAPSKVLDRRGFLKLSGAGLLGVVLLGSVGAGRIWAQTEIGVPMEILMAMGYVNTRWEMPSPETSAYRRGDPHGWGSYGIMALVQNPYSDTLGEASRLTGIPEVELKVDRAANIRGGAALLASSAGGYASGDPSDFYGAVAGRGLAAGQNYSAVSGIGGGALYAEQVFGTLRMGASRTLFSGETVSLPVGVPASGLGNFYGR